MNFPFPFGGIMGFYDFKTDAGLRRFVNELLAGCPRNPDKGLSSDGETTVHHDHNFAIDSTHRRIYGSKLLLLECLPKFINAGYADADEEAIEMATFDPEIVSSQEP